MPKSLHPGDYVLATKYADGDPWDHFCVGFFQGMLEPSIVHTVWDGRYLVSDAQGRLFRANGFRRCEKVSVRVGNAIVAAVAVISGKPGRSLWYWRYHPGQLEELMRD